MITEPEDVAVRPKGAAPALVERMGELIQKFLVLPKDATNFSEAERLGVRTVATLDRDWTRADGFRVFVPS